MGGSTLADGAGKLRILAGEHAAAADRDRALAPEVVAAVREAGFARYFVPTGWGGEGDGGFAELTRAVAGVGEACPATAWGASLWAYASRIAGFLPGEGQRELWSRSPDTLVAAGLIPAGKAAPAEDGGWLLNGQWPYVSGVESSDWVLLCGTVPGAEGGVDFRFFALPRGAYRIRESWDSVGMRATGSHTVVVRDAAVPAHLSFNRVDLFRGRGVPFPAVAGLTFVAPVVGAASGALTAYVEGLTGRKRTASQEIALVRAAGRIEAARRLVEDNAELADSGPFSPPSLARSERNATCAAELLAESVNELMRAAGTSGLAESRPLQRFWRDVTAAAGHVALRYETSAAKNHATALLGPA